MATAAVGKKKAARAPMVEAIIHVPTKRVWLRRNGVVLVQMSSNETNEEVVERVGFRKLGATILAAQTSVIDAFRNAIIVTHPQFVRPHSAR